MATDAEIVRCAWAGEDPLMRAYHDTEWGVPCHDDQRLFELLILEGAQAGLSWLTILRKRDGYRRAFQDFDPAIVAAFGEADVERLLADDRIVRNRLKIRAAIRNARAFLAVQTTEDSFDRYIWAFTGGETLRQRPLGALLPTHSGISDAIARDLRLRGFTFVGTTIVYAFMESIGLVDDHVPGCFRYCK